MHLIKLFQRRRSITFEQLRMIQLIAFQLVCSLEIEGLVPETERRSIACEETLGVVEELRIQVPFSVIESAVDCSLSVLSRADRDATIGDIAV